VEREAKDERQRLRTLVGNRFEGKSVEFRSDGLRRTLWEFDSRKTRADMIEEAED